MCCNCCNAACASCFGNVAYVAQRLASCAAAAAVVTCIMATILLVLGVGVGAGYNYCFVENKLNATLSASKDVSKPKRLYCEHAGKPKIRSQNDPEPIEGPIHPGRKRRSKDFDATQASQINSTESTLEIKPTMVVPLKHFALMILIKDLQEKNKNFTLELIAAKF